MFASLAGFRLNPAKLCILRVRAWVFKIANSSKITFLDPSPTCMFISVYRGPENVFRGIGNSQDPGPKPQNTQFGMA